jgi:hypothetical protein
VYISLAIYEFWGLTVHKITSLALKMCAQHESEWPEWPMSCVQSLSAMGATTESLLDLLAIIAEEIQSADLLPAQKYAYSLLYAP